MAIEGSLLRTEMFQLSIIILAKRAGTLILVSILARWSFWQVIILSRLLAAQVSKMLFFLALALALCSRVVRIDQGAMLWFMTTTEKVCGSKTVMLWSDYYKQLCGSPRTRLMLWSLTTTEQLCGSPRTRL